MGILWLVIVSNVVLFALLSFLLVYLARQTTSPKMFDVFAYVATLTGTFTYSWLIVGGLEWYGVVIESRVWTSIGVLGFAFVFALVTTVFAVQNPIVDQPRSGPIGWIRGGKK